MEIVIGVEFSARELRLESDEEPDAFRKRVEEAYANEDRLLWLTDGKGKQVCVPLAKLTYVELDPSGDSKKVGFNRLAPD